MAEPEMIDYIKKLDMSVFVYDYDHNAPTTEHLAATHYKGYKKVRDAHPDMPIIMMTRPKYHIVEFEKERNAVVRETFGRAISEGDKKVYFIDGRELLDPEMIEWSLVDNCHPADCGFFGMAKRISPLLKNLVK